ncbi:MAG: hypothetical protein HZA00_09930 [Nitrospinae bacterium]|nr:hypothetical protein [Nitrospinota bacterium]
MDNRQKNHIIYLFIFFFSLLYLLIFQNYGLNLWDEGNLLNGSLRTLKGESVYADFNGYPPGRYILGAALFKIFGVDISVIRTAVTVMTSAAVVMLYSISLKIIPPHPPLGKGGLRGGFAIIPPILFLVSPAVYYNRFYPIFTIFGIYMVFWYLDLQHVKTGLEKETSTSPSSPPYKGGGRGVVLALSAFFAMLFKLEIGIGIALISIIILLWRRLPAILYFSLTLSLSMILVILYYKSSIDIYRLIYDTYFQVFKISELWGNPFPNLFSTELWKRFDTYEIFLVLLFYLPPLIYLITLFILIQRRLTPWYKQVLRPVAADSRFPALLAIPLFFGIYTYNLVIWRTGFDNLIRCLPSAWILGAYLLYLLRIRLFKWTGEKILSYAVVLCLPLWFLYMMLFYGDFYTGSIGEMRKPHIPLSMERANNIYTDPIEASWIKEITGYIKNNTSSENTIFVVPLNPLWYFLTDRKNPTYYEWILPGELKTKTEQVKVIEQLKKTVPSFIIYADIAIDNREERRFSNYAPMIFDFIINNYHIEKTVGFFQIWRYGK